MYICIMRKRIIRILLALKGERTRKGFIIPTFDFAVLSDGNGQTLPIHCLRIRKIEPRITYIHSTKDISLLPRWMWVGRLIIFFQAYSKTAVRPPAPASN